MSWNCSARLRNNNNQVHSRSTDCRVEIAEALAVFISQRRRFHEHITNLILDDLVEALKPKWCEVTGDFSMRGGIEKSVKAKYSNRDLLD